MWTAWGLVPEDRVPPGSSRGTVASLKKVAKGALTTARAIWDARIVRLKEWEEERPDLRQRKKEAARRQWRPEGVPAQRKKRERAPPATRAEERTRDAELQKAKRRKTVMDTAEAEVETTIAEAVRQAMAGCTLAPTSLQKEALAKRVRERAKRRHAKFINEPTAKDRATAGTAPMARSGDGPDTMMTTEAMENPEPQHFVWAPRVGTKVKAWWGGGEGTQKLNKQRGAWHDGVVTAAQWEDSGAPTIDIEYPDGTTHEHTSLHLGSLIRPAGRPGPSKKGCPPRDTLLPEYAMEWIGQGAEIEVRRGARWFRGIVRGREGTNILVKYPATARARKRTAKGKTPPTARGKGETIPHGDLGTRGCRIITMRKWQKESGCPYEGWEPACSCDDCQTNRWPRMLARATWGTDTSLSLMQLSPEERLGWIGMGLFFALWKTLVATAPQPRAPRGDPGTGSPPDGTGPAPEPPLGQTTRSILEGYGRTESRTRGDGHCMYRAIAAQSGGSARDWEHLRAMVAKWIREHWILLAEDMSARRVSRRDLLHQVEAYGTEVGPEHYGDEASLYVAAWALHRRIIVVNGASATVITYLPDAGTDAAGEVVLVFDGKNHYNATAPTAPHRKRALPGSPGPENPGRTRTRPTPPEGVDAPARPGFDEACHALERAMGEVEEQRNLLRDGRPADGETAPPGGSPLRGGAGGSRKRPGDPEGSARGPRADGRRTPARAGGRELGTDGSGPREGGPGTDKGPHAGNRPGAKNPEGDSQLNAPETSDARSQILLLTMDPREDETTMDADEQPEEAHAPSSTPLVDQQQEDQAPLAPGEQRDDQAPLAPGEQQDDQAPQAPRARPPPTRARGDAANGRNVRARLGGPGEGAEAAALEPGLAPQADQRQDDQAPPAPGQQRDYQAPPALGEGPPPKRGRGDAANTRNVRAKLWTSGAREAVDRLEEHRKALRGDNKKRKEHTGGPQWGPRSAGAGGRPRKDSGPQEFVEERTGIG